MAGPLSSLWASTALTTFSPTAGPRGRWRAAGGGGGGLGFYQPTIKATSAGATGTITNGLSTWDLTGVADSWVQGTSPGGSWSCEFVLSVALASSSTFIGAVTQEWWNAGPAWSANSQNTAGWWYLGSSSSGSNGSGSGTTHVYNGTNFQGGLASGDTIGLVFNNANRKLNIYRNGVLVVTITYILTTTVYPAFGWWTTRVAGSWRNTPSTYFSSYALP